MARGVSDSVSGGGSDTTPHALQTSSLPQERRCWPTEVRERRQAPSKTFHAIFPHPVRSKV